MIESPVAISLVISLVDEQTPSADPRAPRPISAFGRRAQVRLPGNCVFPFRSYLHGRAAGETLPRLREAVARIDDPFDADDRDARAVCSLLSAWAMAHRDARWHVSLRRADEAALLHP